MEKKLLIILCVIGLPISVFAETIVFKSGKTIEGNILERTEKYITMDFEGVPVIYFMDEIESIAQAETLNDTDAALEVKISASEITPVVTASSDESVPAAEVDTEVLNMGGAPEASLAAEEQPTQGEDLTSVEPQTAEEYLKRGDEFNRQGAASRALADLNKAIELNPNLGGAYASRGFIHYKAKEFDAAWADVYKAKELGFAVDPEFLEGLKKASGKEN